MERFWGISICALFIAGCVSSNEMIRRDTSGRYFQFLIANSVGFEFDQFDPTACEQQLRGIKLDERKPGITFRCSPISAAAELPFQLSMRDRIVGADMSARARTREGCDLLIKQFASDGEFRKSYNIGTTCTNPSEALSPVKIVEREVVPVASAQTSQVALANIEPVKATVTQTVAAASPPTSVALPQSRGTSSQVSTKTDAYASAGQNSILAVSVGDTLVASIHSGERNNCLANLQTIRQRTGEKFSLKCQSEKPQVSALPVLLHFSIEKNVAEVRNINIAYCRYIKEALHVSQPLIDCEESRK